MQVHNEDHPSQSTVHHEDGGPGPLRAVIANVLPFLVLASILAGIFYLRSKNMARFTNWYYNAYGFKEAYKKHQETRQKVLVYFHTSWCGYCRELDRDLFTTPAFNQKFSQVIKVSIDPDQGADEDAIQTQWSVQSYPTLMVIDDWSRPPRKISGFSGRRVVTADEFYHLVMGS